MTVAIVRFGGSNCDRDVMLALRSMGIDAEIVWHRDGLPNDVSGIVLPGGFSYGDYLRAGAIAAQSPITDEVQAVAEAGVPVLGVCNGAQIGCESGLAPGAFTVNEDARFHCEHVYVRVETADTPWTRRHDVGDVIELPIAHGEGRFLASESTYDRILAEDRVLWRYCEPDGSITAAANPNGSLGNVAGVAGRRDNVAVLMPHPERAALPDLDRTDGRPILQSFA